MLENIKNALNKLNGISATIVKSKESTDSAGMSITLPPTLNKNQSKSAEIAKSINLVLKKSLGANNVKASLKQDTRDQSFYFYIEIKNEKAEDIKNLSSTDISDLMQLLPSNKSMVDEISIKPGNSVNKSDYTDCIDNFYKALKLIAKVGKDESTVNGDFKHKKEQIL